MKGKRLAAAAVGMVSLSCSLVLAMTPLSPQLTSQSSTELVRRLAELGFPQVGHNSVLIALTQVLGLTAEARTYDYHEPYPHLPQVQASATPDAAGCVVVALHATYQRPQPGGIQLQGTYCRIEAGRWQAKQQIVTPDP